jgi:carboxymethylenebutenolidase
MIERQIEIATADGRMGTFVCHPERDGPHPVILFLMDAPGIREELRDMVRRLATVGYYVMLPNLYYRANVEELGAFMGEGGAPVRERMMALMAGLTTGAIMADCDAVLAFADRDGAAANGPVGCVGYCMSGPFAINFAGRHPGRIHAAASIYGVALATDLPDSPHRILRASGARLYFGCAESDHWMPTEMVDRLRREIESAGANAELEVYPGVEHGFAFQGRPAYNKAAAERHWERLFALFGPALAPPPKV